MRTVENLIIIDVVYKKHIYNININYGQKKELGCFK